MHKFNIFAPKNQGSSSSYGQKSYIMYIFHKDKKSDMFGYYGKVILQYGTYSTEFTEIPNTAFQQPAVIARI